MVNPLKNRLSSQNIFLLGLLLVGIVVLLVTAFISAKRFRSIQTAVCKVTSPHYTLITDASHIVSDAGKLYQLYQQEGTNANEAAFTIHLQRLSTTLDSLSAYLKDPQCNKVFGSTGGKGWLQERVVQLKQLTDSLKKNLQTEDSLRFPAGVNGKASKDASAFVHHKTAITNLQLLNELSSTLQMVNARESSILENTRGFLKQRVSGFQSYSLTVTVLTVVFLFGVATVAARNIIFTNAYQQQVITEKTEKMAEAKTRFLSNVSHEVRSPLSIIIGFAEQLKNEGDTTMNLQYVCAIHRAAEHLLHTVDDILDFSKLEAGKLELDNQPFDPAAIAKDTTELYQVQARKKGLQLFCDIDLPTDFFVQGDAFRLQQVLLNLVSNALKFTDKGFVQLTLHLQQQQNDNCVLLFTVRDTGVGIATADLQKIFEEFEQSAAKKARERSVRGTGLGLSICKMLVQLQGGTIQVNSKINEGSTFTVALPFTLSQQKPVTATREIQRACVPKGKILLIEDDEMNVLLFSHLLKRYGYPFDIAADGRQAIDMINRNTYHLILTDIDLPFYSGIEITRFVREHKHAGIAATPIVALTANIMQEYTDAFSSAGMNGYITKPVKEHDFIEKIARYL